MKKRFLTLLTLALLTVSCQAQPVFKRPSNKTAFEDKIEFVQTNGAASEQIIEHSGFVVSYNPYLLVPNWVTYELTQDEASANDYSRTDEFLEDPDVKGVKVQSSDYSGSGYDRGHMAPAADMKWSEKAMIESFYMTNICPQNHDLNGGKWLELEQKIRYWTKKYGTTYIATGPIFLSDEVSYISKNKRNIAIPDAFFKIVAQKRDGKWTMAAFVMGNYNETLPLEGYLYTVKSIELMLGFTFFNNPSDPSFSEAKFNLTREDWIIENWK